MISALGTPTIAQVGWCSGGSYVGNGGYWADGGYCYGSSGSYDGHIYANRSGYFGVFGGKDFSYGYYSAGQEIVYRNHVTTGEAGVVVAYNT